MSEQEINEAPRLYAVPYSEHCHDDIAGVYETDIEPYVDEHDRRPRVVAEYTVHPPKYHLPSSEQVVEWLVEWATDRGELTEDAADHLERNVDHDAVHAAAEALLDAVAARMRYRMANRRVAEHTITWDCDGAPLVDGDPLYRPASPTPGASS